MKKEFELAEIEIICFDKQDIIITSGEGEGAGTGEDHSGDGPGLEDGQ